MGAGGGEAAAALGARGLHSCVGSVRQRGRDPALLSPPSTAWDGLGAERRFLEERTRSVGRLRWCLFNLSLSGTIFQHLTKHWHKRQGSAWHHSLPLPGH